jgi:hypothetical protein
VVRAWAHEEPRAVASRVAKLVRSRREIRSTTSRRIGV